MSITFGVSPIAWINDDMPELGGDTPLSTVLQDAQNIGFSGIELGGKFPKDPSELKALLNRYHLALVGGWYSCELLTRSAQDEIAALQGHLGLLKAMGCDVFVIAETSNAIHGQRGTPLRTRPHLSGDDWVLFGERMTQVGDYLKSQGLALAYHHHLGTVVEDADDLAAFLAHTGPSVGLTLDTGHAVLGGIDPFAVVRDHPARIVHVHCKDIRQAIFDETAGKDTSFLDGVLAGMFTVPGDGSIDYIRFMKALAGIDYSGWIIIEAEQDPAKADPRRYAQMGLDTLRQAVSTSGLLEAAVV